MELSIKRDNLLKPLQAVSGLVERKQTKPILSNVLLDARGHELTLIATDLEMEMSFKLHLESALQEHQITAPARKLLDICRALPQESIIKIKTQQEKLQVTAGRSRFSLQTLPANEFPVFNPPQALQTYSIDQIKLKRLMEHTAFAMAQQDVRYFLNGLLLELSESGIRAVATDGHRLAFSEEDHDQSFSQRQQVIIPRKAVLEIQRLLAGNETLLLSWGEHHLELSTTEFSFCCKLVDGKFPDYENVIPRPGPIEFIVNREALKEVLLRVSILSHEKHRSVRLNLVSGLIKVETNNPEREVAEEELEVDYTGEAVELGYNVGYLIDVLTAMKEPLIKFSVSGEGGSALLTEVDGSKSRYVVMPMKL